MVRQVQKRTKGDARGKVEKLRVACLPATCVTYFCRLQAEQSCPLRACKEIRTGKSLCLLQVTSPVGIYASLVFLLEISSPETPGHYCLFLKAETLLYQLGNSFQMALILV